MSKSSQTQASATQTSTLSFEDAMRELEAIVAQLEDGAPSLDEAISLVKRGQELALQCEQILNDAELALSTLVATGDGELVEEEMDWDGDE